MRDAHLYPSTWKAEEPQEDPTSKLARKDEQTGHPREPVLTEVVSPLKVLDPFSPPPLHDSNTDTRLFGPVSLRITSLELLRDKSLTSLRSDGHTNVIVTAGL